MQELCANTVKTAPIFLYCCIYMRCIGRKVKSCIYWCLLPNTVPWFNLAASSWAPDSHSLAPRITQLLTCASPLLSGMGRRKDKK